MAPYHTSLQISRVVVNKTCQETHLPGDSKLKNLLPSKYDAYKSKYDEILEEPLLSVKIKHRKTYPKTKDTVGI